jgi:4-amino-4-deoxy-L-arabinose transferase-like glycosyltransferase
MRLAKAGLPLLVVAAFVAARWSNLAAPFVNLLDTGFQEAIALHHLGGKVVANRFLPVIAEVDGVKIFHTAHPPLLHLLYAGLYGVFGVHEWVSRLCSLALYLGSLGLGFRHLTAGRGSAARFAALALFMPLPFALTLTTNYEPLSIFAVTLIAAAFFRWQQAPGPGRRFALLAAVLLACLTDWPAYLAVPVLFLLHWRRPTERKILLALLALEAAAFAAILFWQYAAAGEIVFFGHAATRNNPAVLLDPQTFRMLCDHLLQLQGAAPLCLCLVWLLLVIKEGAPWSPGLRFFTLFFPVLFLAAPQLVVKHEVYLFYLAPALTFLAYEALLRSTRPWLLLAIALAVAFPFDLRHACTRNYRYYYLAEQVRNWPQVRLAFSTPAIGLFRYYDGIETVFPTSAAATRLLRERPFDLIALDLANAEVAPVISEVSEHQDHVRLRYVFSDEQYFVRASLLPRDFYLAVAKGWAGSKDWRAPRPEVIQTASGLDYALRQHPAGMKPAAFRFIEPIRLRLTFAPALVHPLPFRVPSDGAGFVILAETGSRKRLLFSRYLPDPAGRGAVLPEYSLSANLSALSTLYLSTNPGPRNNFAFDDAAWLAARVFPLEGSP